MSFPSYPEYRDSGCQWPCEIPSHWFLVKIKQKLRLLSLKSDKKIKPVGLENIQSWTGKFIASDTQFEGDGIDFDIGDILFGKLRPYLAKVYLAAFKGEAVGDFLVLRASQSVYPRFAQYIMLNQSFIDLVDGSTYGSKMPRVNWEFFGNMLIPMPLKEEQKIIADFLDQETKKIDALIAEQENLINLLKEKWQGVITKAVTNGLDPNVKMKDSGVEWLGLVPAHWDVRKLKQVATASNGLTYSPEDVVDEVDGTLVLRSSNIQNGELSLSDNVYVNMVVPKKSIANYDDILICSRNGSRALIGKNALITKELDGVAYGAFMMLLRSTISRHIYWILNSFIFEFQSSLFLTSTINQLTVADLYSFQIPIPPIDEQNQINNHLIKIKTEINILINESENSIKILRERRSALISAAVTGQIDVRNVAITKEAA